MIPLLDKYLEDKSNLVDIGCGKGLWLDALKKTHPKLDLFGVEPSADDNIIEKYNIIKEFLGDIDYKNKFDVCSLMSVIEHVTDPISYLKQCYRLLKDLGLIFITAPNMSGFDSLALNIADRNWGIPQHINYFDIASIQRCVRDVGFSVVECGTFGKLDVEIVSKSGKILKNDFLTKLLTHESNEKVRKEFQKFLTKNSLSGQLYLIAQKK